MFMCHRADTFIAFFSGLFLQSYPVFCFKITSFHCLTSQVNIPRNILTLHRVDKGSLIASPSMEQTVSYL